MDRTKEFILQCEKAVEVQELFKATDGDFYIENVYRKKGLVETANGGWTTSERKNFDGVWLPRQDQLQGIVEKHKRQGHIEQRFHEFCKSLPEHDKNRIYYLNLGWSMEQLWLAFVMKEKFNKTWDGKEWILQNQ